MIIWRPTTTSAVRCICLGHQARTGRRWDVLGWRISHSLCAFLMCFHCKWCFASQVSHKTHVCWLVLSNQCQALLCFPEEKFYFTLIISAKVMENTFLCGLRERLFLCFLLFSSVVWACLAILSAYILCQEMPWATPWGNPESRETTKSRAAGKGS